MSVAWIMASSGMWKWTGTSVEGIGQGVSSKGPLPGLCYLQFMMWNLCVKASSCASGQPITSCASKGERSKATCFGVINRADQHDSNPTTTFVERHGTCQIYIDDCATAISHMSNSFTIRMSAFHLILLGVFKRRESTLDRHRSQSRRRLPPK